MQVNGIYITGYQGKNLIAFLEEQGYQKERIAVEKNGEIIPKSNYADTYLSEHDKLEIVSFVGGG